MTTLIAGPSGRAGRPFGTVLAAMVTPFTATGELDVAATGQLAEKLINDGNDGLVVNGTTGESPTTTDAEKELVIRAVVDAVGDRATVVAGVGTYDTAHSVRLAKAAEKAGAHGTLVVTPYYSRPQQEGLLAHFAAVADASGLPVMLYDIPPRSVVAIEPETLLRLAEHPRIHAVKDAKGDLFASSQVMAATDLQYYSGDDVLNLAHLTQGAVGIASVVAHVAGSHYAEMVAAVAAGDLPRAIALHRQLIPAVNAVMNITQGAIMVKAALKEQGVLASAAVRLPLVEATTDQVALVRDGLRQSGLT
jgi:4-hydroxy-tetrahydrodipicolinate synthase